MISVELDELRKNCTGYDEEGWPKTASSHAIHHKECDGCERACPLIARKIKSEFRKNRQMEHKTKEESIDYGKKLDKRQR